MNRTHIDQKNEWFETVNRLSPIPIIDHKYLAHDVIGREGYCACAITMDFYCDRKPEDHVA